MQEIHSWSSEIDNKVTLKGGETSAMKVEKALRGIPGITVSIAVNTSLFNSKNQEITRFYCDSSFDEASQKKLKKMIETLISATTGYFSNSQKFEKKKAEIKAFCEAAFSIAAAPLSAAPAPLSAAPPHVLDIEEVKLAADVQLEHLEDGGSSQAAGFVFVPSSLTNTSSNFFQAPEDVTLSNPLTPQAASAPEVALPPVQNNAAPPEEKGGKPCCCIL